MKNRILIAAGAAALASVASADVALSTFTFSDLESDYFTSDGNSGFYTARAGAFTSGDVTRVQVPSSQTAEYQSAFALDDASLADVVFEMSVSNITGLRADGVGSFTISDLDGDNITGTLTGQWTRAFQGAPIMFFTGTLTEVTFNADGDGLFEGTDGVGFDLSPYMLGNIFEGGLVQVSFGLDSFFEESFSGFNSQFSGVIVPTPGAALLVLGAGGVIVRRRR